MRAARVRRLVRLNNDWRRLAGELHLLLARRDSLGDFLELARHSRNPRPITNRGGALSPGVAPVLQPWG